jgi:uncharacterized membrane protein YtjA (UPF0391 family)
MFSAAIAFFVIAIVSAVFAVSGLASDPTGVASILFIVFMVLFGASLVAGLLNRR